MKIDIDSIFYIILSIIILVVSGLGSRRRKQMRQMRTSSPSPVQAGIQTQDESEKSQPRQSVVDPFERLEQILTGQPRYESLHEESMEILDDEEELIVDEEEKILSSTYAEQKEGKGDLASEEVDDDPGEQAIGWFQDVDEITRAVIYSQILPRKYI